METYTEAKPLQDNPNFARQRQKSLAGLDDSQLDRPIVDAVKALNSLPHCFTLQCCFGHFVYPGQGDPNNLERLPRMGGIESVEYRIAYVAFCVENSIAGRMLLEALKRLAALDPENVQFGCAEWFWERQVNSYVLQIEPERFEDADRAVVDYTEALRLEQTQDAFFARLREMLHQ